MGMGIEGGPIEEIRRMNEQNDGKGEVETLGVEAIIPEIREANFLATVEDPLEATGKLVSDDDQSTEIAESELEDRFSNRKQSLHDGSRASQPPDMLQPSDKN